MIISKQIYTFIAVVQCGSFKKAAEQSYISTSAIIQQTNLLEQEVGAELLRRTYKGVELTKAGEVFYKKACAIVANVDEAIRLTKQAANVSAASITIAYAQNLQYPHIYGIRQLYARENGGAMNLIPMPYEDTLRGVSEGHYDACFIQLGKRVRQSGLKTVPLRIQKPSLAVFKDHPLANKAKITISDLKDTKIVLPEKGLYDSSDTLYDEIRENGVNAEVVSITGLLESELYCREHGAARLCARRVLDPEMVMVPFETKARYTICLAYRPGDQNMETMAELIRITKAYCKATLDQED